MINLCTKFHCNMSTNNGDTRGEGGGGGGGYVRCS